jgi:hypothetical protein
MAKKKSIKATAFYSTKTHPHAQVAINLMLRDGLTFLLCDLELICRCECRQNNWKKEKINPC